MLNVTLRVWRQRSQKDSGHWEVHRLTELSRDLSFLDMLDQLNDELIGRGERPIEFDHDCREGICGACGFMIDGRPHGPLLATTVCQLHLREFPANAKLTIEPFRSRAFPVVCDLKVDRSSLDRLVQAGGFISTNIGAAPESNSILVAQQAAQAAFNAAACIGCGACVASCKNSSAALFAGAKVSHLAQLPQGQVERKQRVLAMVQSMDHEGFGHCSNTEACSMVCPQGISTQEIARMNWEYVRARFLQILGGQ